MKLVLLTSNFFVIQIIVKSRHGILIYNLFKEGPVQIDSENI